MFIIIIIFFMLGTLVTSMNIGISVSVYMLGISNVALSYTSWGHACFTEKSKLGDRFQKYRSNNVQGYVYHRKVKTR